jgi:hypothetical protein
MKKSPSLTYSTTFVAMFTMLLAAGAATGCSGGADDGAAETGSEAARGITAADVHVAYVDAVYTTLFQRPTDPGFAYWSGLMDQGVSKNAIAQFLVYSAEGQAHVAAVLATPDPITTTYQQLLARAPDPWGYGVWTNNFHQEAPIIGAQAALSNIMVGFLVSPEFAQNIHICQVLPPFFFDPVNTCS